VPARKLVSGLGIVMPVMAALAAGWVVSAKSGEGDAMRPEAADVSVFVGPAVAYATAPPELDQAGLAEGVLRWVWVEERMQISRRGAAVRVPIFLLEGECQDPAELALVKWPSRETILVQADDVRRGPDGGVARLHLWANVDLKPGESQRWALVKQPRRAQSNRVVAVSVKAGGLQIAAAGTELSFALRDVRGGALRALKHIGGPDLLFPDGAGPEVTWKDESGDSQVIAANENQVVGWASGPIFAKVVVGSKSAGGPLQMEQVWRVFRDGSINVVQVLTPADSSSGLTIDRQLFFVGTFAGSKEVRVRSQTAGIIESLVDVHAGYAVDFVVQGSREKGWLIEPGSMDGKVGRVNLGDADVMTVTAPEGLVRRGRESEESPVRAFWAELNLLPVQRDGDRVQRAALLAAAQPLVGVVEHPGLNVDRAIARIEDNVREIKPVGWVNQTVLKSLAGRKEVFPRRAWSKEADAVSWRAAAQRAEDRLTNQGTRELREDEKGKAAGSLDPYHITYGATGLARWLWSGGMPPPALASLRAQLTAVRGQLGRSDDQGWPYLNVFHRAQNMQMGPMFLALADAGAAPELQRFYRDMVAAPHVQAVLPRGKRPYAGQPQTTAGESDTLYQAVVDFYLRATELSLNESLGFHPVALGRYLDSVDVNADLYHPFHPRDDVESVGLARANFFRTQSHLHRWLGWGPAPFIALLVKPREDGVVPGVTEAWYYADALVGRWKNWPDQSWLYLSTVLPRRAQGFNPAARPESALPLIVNRKGEGNQVSWTEVPGAREYRVYRMRVGEAPVWLNSPYAKRAANTRSSHDRQWFDRDGQRGDRYRVHIVDATGRESAW
jgi:hypothetical protein